MISLFLAVIPNPPHSGGVRNLLFLLGSVLSSRAKPRDLLLLRLRGRSFSSDIKPRYTPSFRTERPGFFFRPFSGRRVAERGSPPIASRLLRAMNLPVSFSRNHQHSPTPKTSELTNSRIHRKNIRVLALQLPLEHAFQLGCSNKMYPPADSFGTCPSSGPAAPAEKENS